MSSPKSSALDVRARHLRILRLLSVSSLLLTVLLLYTASQFPLFDSSPLVLLSPRHDVLERIAFPLFRWDAFHFAHIAQDGYVYEHEWAFFPGAPFVMRTVGELLRRIHAGDKLTVAHLLVGGGLASLLCGTTTTLYDLTVHYFGSPSIAYLACVLSLLPSSPATLRFAAYTEPFFTYFSYRGMLCCARSEWLHASLFFTVASTFRSNGFMLGGYILWGMVVGPFFAMQKVPLLRVGQAALLTGLIFTPFFYHQYNAYLAFCTGPHTPNTPPWCTFRVPFVYSYVQEKYWNVGLLRYWTAAQAPNILLAAPVLGVLLAFCTAHTLRTTLPLVLSHPLFSRLAAFLPMARRTRSRFLSNTHIVPHVLHALALSLILLVAAHTQIALRLAASLPTTYWAAAWLVVEHPRAGRWWVAWSVVWGAVSVVLWAAFLPPA